MSEKEIELKFREAVERAGGCAYKFISPGTAGMPDRIVVLPGGHIGFVELKALGRGPRPLQRLRMRELNRRGCSVHVLNNPKDIPVVLAAIREHQPVKEAQT